MDNIHETHDTKYVRELIEYWDTFMFALINEIYVGVGVAMGLPEEKAYRLAKTRPGTLAKAGFFSSIFNKFRFLFPRKIKKFRIKDGVFGSGKPMSEKQWDVFNQSLDKYFKEYANAVTEDMAVKTFLMGRETAKFREKKKPYQNKSLFQVVEDQYGGEMPDNIRDAYRKYDFSNAEKTILNRSMSNAAMYVQETNNEIKEAIRKQVQAGIDSNKSVTKIASDLYWNVQKDEDLLNKYSAESLRRNWHRIAQTEVASIYEAGILAPYEADAMESLKDPGKAMYFVRTGGTCPWCRSKQGTIVRLIPAAIVESSKEESLSAMGIKDPNTDIAIWPGKNNVGLKQAEWNICCPAHPYNVATFQRIDLKSQFYNKKTGRVEYRQEKQEFVPQMKDYSYKSKEEKEYNKPTDIGGGLVRFNGNVYEAFPAGVADKKLDEWRKNPSLPIPVQIGSPQYRRIFEAAK